MKYKLTQIKSNGIKFKYFSPKSVKNMDKEEIRKNYDDIILSMKYWG